MPKLQAARPRGPKEEISIHWTVQGPTGGSLSEAGNSIQASQCAVSADVLGLCAHRAFRLGSYSP